MTAPGTIPTAMNATSSGRTPPARARIPASTRDATIDRHQRDDRPAHDSGRPDSWANGSNWKARTAIGTVA